MHMRPLAFLNDGATVWAIAQEFVDRAVDTVVIGPICRSPDNDEMYFVTLSGHRGSDDGALLDRFSLDHLALSQMRLTLIAALGQQHRVEVCVFDDELCAAYAAAAIWPTYQIVLQGMLAEEARRETPRVLH